MTATTQDLINADGDALDALAKLIGDACRAIDAFKNASGLADAEHLKDTRDSLIDAEGHLEAAKEDVDAERTWPCETTSSFGCTNELDARRRLRDGETLCEKCAEREAREHADFIRQESYPGCRGYEREWSR